MIREVFARAGLISWPTYALILFTLFFVGVVIWSLWPGQKERFDEAAQLPLTDDEINMEGAHHHG